MNKTILIGRLTKDPEIRYSQGENSMAIANYTLAVDRRKSKTEGDSADFIRCIAFGKSAEFAEKYLHKGTKIAVLGHIQTGSYTNKEGQKVYTTEVIIDEQEFAESKKDGNHNVSQQQNAYPNGNVNGAYPQNNGGYQQQGACPPNNGAYQQQGAYPPNNGGYQQQGAYPPNNGVYQQPNGMMTPGNQGFNPNQGFMNIPDGIDEELPFN